MRRPGFDPTAPRLFTSAPVGNRPQCAVIERHPRRAEARLWRYSTAGAQNIFTVAGIPYSHRDSVDGKPALNAPLNNVHGLLIDKVTGRLLFSDRSLVSRLEPDGTLLAVVGRG